MSPEEHAAAILFWLAERLHDAVKRGHYIALEQDAGIKTTGSVKGKDGRDWAVNEPSGEYRFVLTIDPSAPTQENTQAKTADAEIKREPASAST